MMTSRLLLLLLLLLFGLLGCGGGSAPSEPPSPVVPGDPLPVLTMLTIVIPTSDLPAGQRLAAGIAAVDERGRPMQVGLVGWTTSDPTIARVFSDGVILGLSPGAVTIRASVGEVSTQRLIQIGPLPPGPIPVASISVAPVAVSVQVGNRARLVVVLSDFAGRPLSDREFTWSTGNDSIATVSADGTVIARSVGVVVVEASTEGIRGAAQITVTQALDAGIAISMAVPVANDVVLDSLTIVATVRSSLPLLSVVVTIAGNQYPMTYGQIPKSTKGPAWSVIADVSSLPYGPLAVVVTATDSRGGISMVVIPIRRDASLTPGSKSPPRSK